MLAPNIQRNPFDMSHMRKLSGYMANLMPIMCEEILPGDFFKVRTSFVVRLSPLLAPVMHQIDVFCHYFFVPNRLVWTNFESFITGGAQGTDATVHPYIAFSNPGVGSLADFLNVSPRLNTGVTPPVAIAYANPVNVNALPFRAYSLIWNEWYRDETLQTALVVNKGDGADATTNITLQKRCWEKDYFTSALPWAQRGAAVSIPLSATAPVTRVSNANEWKAYVKASNTLATNINPLRTGGSGQLTDAIASDLSLDPNGGLIADLAAVPGTIEALRQAVQVQKWMERNARGGARYVEAILAHFGVRSSDARLQRPEFLGGGRSPVVVSEVLQTSATGATGTPLAEMAGHAFSANQGNMFEREFEEHGFLIGIMSIMPRSEYYQGLPRMFSRSSRYDYFWPEFAHLGEQAVLNKEVFVDGDTNPSTGDPGIFGYQGRYDEYRRRESSVHGDYRTSLEFWHMARKFTARPTLSSAFVQADPTMRISAVTSAPNCLVQVHNDVMAVRPLPIEGIPGGL